MLSSSSVLLLTKEVVSVALGAMVMKEDVLNNPAKKESYEDVVMKQEDPSQPAARQSAKPKQHTPTYSFSPMYQCTLRMDIQTW